MGSDNERFQQWRRADRVTLHTSRDPLTKLLIEACSSGDGVRIIYYGGSTPGASRVIYPLRLFKVKGYDSIYVEAYCQSRGENRVFRLDKIQLVYPPQVTRQAQPQSHLTTTPIQDYSSPGLGCLMYLVVGILSGLILLAIVLGSFGR